MLNGSLIKNIKATLNMVIKKYRIKYSYYCEFNFLIFIGIYIKKIKKN